MYACPGFMHAAVGRRSPVKLAKADAYSAGATLFEVLTGRLPAPLPVDAGYPDYSHYFDRRVGNGQSFLKSWSHRCAIPFNAHVDLAVIVT